MTLPVLKALVPCEHDQMDRHRLSGLPPYYVMTNSPEEAAAEQAKWCPGATIYTANTDHAIRLKATWMVVNVDEIIDALQAGTRPATP